MDLQLGELFLVGDPGSIPSTHILTTIPNFSPRGPSTLFWSHWTSAHIHASKTPIHIKTNKSFIERSKYPVEKLKLKIEITRFHIHAFKKKKITKSVYRYKKVRKKYQIPWYYYNFDLIFVKAYWKPDS